MLCENSTHPCYKCDGGCGSIVENGYDDECQRICDSCMEEEEEVCFFLFFFLEQPPLQVLFLICVLCF